MPNTAPNASLCIFLDPDEWRVLAPPIFHQYSNKILTWEF